jgi:pSer/pThr/pTyr-binding forkhead associated (FHA) protein
MPRITVSLDGQTVSEYTFTSNKVLVGRSDFADIVLEDEFVSKLHLALIWFDEALLLIDLKSANGTAVNSVKTRKALLQENDVISLGSYRLTVSNAPSLSDELRPYVHDPGTLRMHKLIDLRRERARHQVALVEDDEQD